MSTHRKTALDIVDEAFAESWNPHTSAQVDNNVRDVLYTVVEKILASIEKKEKATQTKKKSAK